jgi:bifunctional non-homologous end joining protein LigD
MRKGELRFVLDGTRLHGRFTLVRLKPRPGQRSRQDNWLLIKGHDEAEQRGADAPAIEREAPATKPGREPRDEPPAKGAKRGKLPQLQAPQLASVADEPPEGDDWVSEIKFDGYRLLCGLDQGNVRVVTRSGLDWTDRLPAVARAVAGLNAETALVDGELVALDKQGASSFPALQAALSGGKDHTLYFYLFDLLHLDGWDLRDCALLERKRVLHDLDPGQGMLRYSDHQVGAAVRMRDEACRLGPGRHRVQARRRAMRAGRGHGWVKVKCRGRENSLFLGWTPPKAAAQGSARCTSATTTSRAGCTMRAASAPGSPRTYWCG